MKAVRSEWTVWAAVVAASLPWALPIQAATKAEQARAAARLVEETLQCEAKEGVADRADLLRPALQQASNCEAAWWQSGFVYDSKRKEWLRWDEFQQLAAEDDRLAAYRRARAKCPETIDGQIKLARWCSKHKLEDQARAHLTRVLEFNPNHAEARQHLGFRSVNGTWVDEHDIAEAQTFADKASAGAAKWGPRLEKLHARLANGNAGQRERARAELLAIRDSDAVGAIEVVFCRQTSEMALLGIELLKNIQSPQAAAVLAWHATFSPWPQVRQAAATALRSQEKHDYVPLLLAAAQTSTGPQTRGADSAGGPTSPGDSTSPASSTSPGTPAHATYPRVPEVRMVYRLDHSTSSYSWSTVEPLKEHPYWWQIPQARFDPKSPDPVAKKTSTTVTQGGDRSTLQKREYYVVRGDRIQTLRTDNKVTTNRETLTPVPALVYPRYPQQANPYPPQADTPSYNNQPTARTTACSALAEVTGQKGARSPSEWWDWWYDYNEVYQPSSKRPKALERSNSKAATGGEAQVQRDDCLAAGTLVCAETGPTVIDKIAVGDRVFCCDPETGCLALKPVLRKTVRPEGRLLKIRAGGEEFEASGGHVFWVAGRGWIKARDLHEGMQLHTIRGTVPVEDIKPGTVQTTFSLVSADFHTFFAGKGMVLTHDNTIRPPTDRIVPGLAAKAVRPVEP
jgi:hypothetical protein